MEHSRRVLRSVDWFQSGRKAASCSGAEPAAGIQRGCGGAGCHDGLERRHKRAGSGRPGHIPCSQYFALSDNENNEVQVWDLLSKKRIDLVQRSEVGRIQFHPTKQLLAVGYADRKIRIWSLPDARILTEIPQDGAIEFGSAAIHFTPDGKHLVRREGGSWSLYGEYVSFFAWQPDDLIRHACARTISKKLDASLWAEQLPGQSYRETCGE
jgi:hypothetical protein